MITFSGTYSISFFDSTISGSFTGLSLPFAISAAFAIGNGLALSATLTALSNAPYVFINCY